MPIQVYSITTRGHNLGGSQRCNSKEEAEAIYATLLDAVTSEKPFFELEIGGNKICFRTKDLAGFGLNVHMEETPEEAKAREIARIEQGYYPNALPYVGEVSAKGYIGSGIL